MSKDNLNTIVENLALTGLFNDNTKSVKLFNKLKSIENKIKNTYILESHSNIDIFNKISDVIYLYNLPVLTEHTINLGDLKYSKDYGKNVFNNFNIYENGIIIIMINNKYLIIERKWDCFIPEVIIDYKNITINWVSSSTNSIKIINNHFEEKNKKKQLIKRDITQIAELRMTLVGIITDLFWIDDKNINYRDNYLPSHISFLRNDNHSLCKWFLNYNTAKNRHFVITCCNVN